MNLKKYKGAVIGAGFMGASYNQGILSHAGAFKEHPNFDLVALCDTSKESLSNAASHWRAAPFNNIEELMVKAKPDIVSICSPNQFHVEQLDIVAKYSPLAIILEKPVTQSIAQISTILEKFKNSNSIIAVNYSRRYLKAYHELKAILETEVIRQVTIRYSKGIKHNGAHAIDLIRFLTGEIIEYKILSSFVDYSKTDPSVSVFLKTTNCDNVFLQALNQNDYVYFDIDIFTNRSRFTITADHQLFSIYEVKENHGTPPGNRLVLTKEQHINHPQAVLMMLDNLANVLNGKEGYLCSLQEALLSEKITLAISDQLLINMPINSYSYEQS